MDVGCFRVLRDGKYDLDFKILDDANRFIMLACLVDLYKLSYGSIQWSTEGPFDQDDWEAWQKSTASAGIQVLEDALHHGDQP